MEIEDIEDQIKQVFENLKSKETELAVSTDEIENRCLALFYISLHSSITKSGIFDDHLAEDVNKFVKYWKEKVEEKTGKSLDELADKYWG